MSEQHPTFAERALFEFNDLKELRRSHPALFWSLLFVVVIFGALFAYDKFWGIPKLKETIADQKQQIMLLETQLAPFKAVALERYPGVVTDALARLGNDLGTLQKQFIDEKLSIKQLDASILIKLAITWKTKPVKGLMPQGGGATIIVIFVLNDGNTVAVPFHGEESLIFDFPNGNMTTIQYTAFGSPGSKIFGLKPTDITYVRSIICATFCLYNKDNIVSPEVKLQELAIKFFVNGQASFECQTFVDEQLDVSAPPIQQFGLLFWNGYIPINFIKNP